MPAGGIANTHISDIVSNTAWSFDTSNPGIKEWGALTVDTHAAGCVRTSDGAASWNTYVATIDVDVGISTNDASISMWITEDHTYVWQNGNNGAACDPSTVAISTSEMETKIKAAIDNANGGTCTTYPTVTVKCHNRIEAAESSVLVVLPSSVPLCLSARQIGGTPLAPRS